MVSSGQQLDVLTIGEMVVDFISAEKTDTLSNATTFRRYLGGSPANIGGMLLKSELQRHGGVTDHLQVAHTTNASVIFVSSTADFEEFRIGDYLLEPKEVSDEAIDRAEVGSSRSTRTTTRASGPNARKAGRCYVRLEASPL